MGTAQLPDAISRYLTLVSSARAADPADVLACFTDDAHVVDIDDIRHGHGEIRDWWTGPVTAFQYTVEVPSAHAVGGGRYVARTRLSGDFPGGTVELANRFTLRDGLIARLEIAATSSGASADA
jgi:ketosteroid isomerase-like protein